jgi:uncharacterized spore protein YtfJ
MTTDAQPIAPETPRRRADELLASVADRLGAHYGASSVFGAPVERDGVTVVPVAAVRFGFGGGTGSDPAKGGEGEGAGAGGSMTAAGYIELKDGRSRFVPIVRPERMVALACLGLVAVLMLARPVARTRRRMPFMS